MKTRVKIKDIKAEWLNARCLNLAAKYAKLAHFEDGTVINLMNSDCVVDLVNHAKTTQSHQLQAVYGELKVALRALLTEERLQEEIEVLKKYQTTSVLEYATE